MEAAGGMDKIEQLQAHEQQEIYEKAMKIIEQYFGYADEDQSLAPQVQGQNFGFGVTPGTQVPQGGFTFGQ